LPYFCSGKGEDKLAVKNPTYNKFVAKLLRRWFNCLQKCSKEIRGSKKIANSIYER